jgi:hypothetical protein
MDEPALLGLGACLDQPRALGLVDKFETPDPGQVHHRGDDRHGKVATHDRSRS